MNGGRNKTSVANIGIGKISLRVRKRKYRQHWGKYQKISENVVRMKNNVVRMKISENIADPDFEDNIANIAILSRCW
jgi:hypothetical protein